MPNYPNSSGTTTTPTFPPFAIYPGDRIALFNAENPTPPQASDRCSIADVYGTDDVGVTVVITYASAPGSVQMDIQMATADNDAAYNTIYSSSNVNGESVNLNVQRQPFIRIRKVAQSGGGAVTAVVCR